MKLLLFYPSASLSGCINNQKTYFNESIVNTQYLLLVSYTMIKLPMDDPLSSLILYKTKREYLSNVNVLYKNKHQISKINMKIIFKKN